ncbi:MAG: tetratricopeptide repeat protein [Candidatus Thorarchaeota archaeon]
MSDKDLFAEVKELRKLGQYHQALTRLAELRDRIDSNDYRKQLESLNLQNYCLWQVGQFAKAETSSRRAAQLAEAQNEMGGLAEALCVLGVVLLDTGRLDESEKALEQSLELFGALNDKRNMSRALNNLGVVFSEKGDLEESFRLWNKTLEVNKELQDNPAIGQSLINLGEVYRMKGDLDRAEEAYEESLLFFEDFEKQDISLAKHNLGLVYYQRGQLEQAEANFRETLSLIEKIDNPKDIADSHYELTRVLLAQNKVQEAEFHIRLLAELARTTNLPDVLVKLHMVQSLHQLKEYELKSALQSAQKAKKIALESPWFFLQIEAMHLVLQSLLQLYLISKQESFRKQVENELVELEKLTQREQINEALATTILIRGLLKKSEYDLLESQAAFEKAKNLAEKHNLSLIAEKARAELVNLELQRTQDAKTGLFQANEHLNLENVITFVKSLQEPLTLDPSQLFMFAIRFGPKGPEVFKAEQTPFSETETSSLFIKSAVFISTALGQGSVYHKGLFGPFPLPNDYSCLVYASLLPDATIQDKRWEGMTYALVCLGYPKRFDNLFVDRDSTAGIFEEWTEKISDVWGITDEFLGELREEIASSCFSTIQFLRHLD